MEQNQEQEEGRFLRYMEQDDGNGQLDIYAVYASDEGETFKFLDKIPYDIWYASGYEAAKAAEEHYDSMHRDLRNILKQFINEDYSDEYIIDILKECRDKKKIYIDEGSRVYLKSDDEKVRLKLSRIERALLILFLSHTEGVFLKDLPKYKDELYRIYSRITNRESKEAAQKSISSIIVPGNANLYVRLSSIKKAFREHLSLSLLKEYFPCAKQGKYDFIQFNADLIQWQTKPSFPV